ncbi:MAG: sensor histidine kinase [Bacteroidia bacterium]
MRKPLLLLVFIALYNGLCAQSYIEKLDLIEQQCELRPTQSLRALDSIYSVVAKNDDYYSKGRVFILKGITFAQIGSRDSSMTFFDQALKIYRAKSDSIGLVKSWLSMASNNSKFNAYLQAFNTLDSSLLVAKSLKDTSLIIETLLSKARLSYYQLENSQAAIWLREARKYSINYKEKNRLNRFFDSYIYGVLKFYEDAKEDSSIFYYKKSLGFIDTSIVSYNYLNVLDGISDAYYFIRKDDSANFYRKKCLKALSSFPSTPTSQIFVWASIKLDLAKGDALVAESKYDKLYQLAKEWPPFYSEGFFSAGARYYTQRAVSLKEQKRFGESNTAYSKALEFITQKNLANEKIGRIQQKIAIEDVPVKYKNDVLKAKNETLLAENEKAQTRARLFQVVTIGAGFAILIIVIILILVRRNLENRRQLAEATALLKEQELEELKRNQQMERMGALLEGQEKERTRIAAELHDGIGGLLASTKHQFQLVESKMIKDVPEFSKAYVTLDDTAQEVRRISHNMASKTLNKFGFTAAIKDLADTLSSHNLSIHFAGTDIPKDLSSDVQLNLYRVVQELLGNVLKHSEASICNIDITGYDDEIVLLIEDNGKGFKLSDSMEYEGIGISNMKLRVEHLEGRIEFDSSPSHGTTVVINVPLKMAI